MKNRFKTFASNSSAAFIEWDLQSSIRINRAVHIPSVRAFFATISRMGDGPLWYALMLILPFTATQGLTASLHMVIFGLLGVSTYKIIKAKTSRPRPFVQCPEITLGCPPLDQWSFPSGHTLHAVGFSVILCHHFPSLAWTCIPFAGLVAASRVILGLHFVSDVIMGASIGLLISSAIITL